MARTFSTGFLLGATFSTGIALGAGGVIYVASSAPGEASDRTRSQLAEAGAATDTGDHRELFDESLEEAEKLEAERITKEWPDDFEPKTFEVVMRGEPNEVEEEVELDEGESLSDAIRRLEEGYRTLLAQQEQLLRAHEEADRVVSDEADRRDDAEQRDAERDDGQQRDTYEASLRPSDEHRFAHSQDDGYEDDGHGPKGQPAQVIGTQNNYIAVSHVTPIYVVQPQDRDRDDRASDEKRKKRVSRYEDLGLQRAILQPTSTTSAYFGGRAASPWSPIDMTGHQNPWAVTPLP